MLVHKCDKCGKLISEEEREDVVSVDIGRYSRQEFCKKCGEPVARILKRYKLLKYV